MTLDPAVTVKLMLDEPALSARLALAIAHLEKEWKKLPLDIRFPNSVNPVLQELRVSLRDHLDSGPLSRGDLNARLEVWLRERAAMADLLILLAFVVETDRALRPFRDVPQALSFLRGRYTPPSGLGGDVWIWEGSPALFRDLCAELRERSRSTTRLTPLRLYDPRLSGWLSSIRFTRSLAVEREIRCESLAPHVLERFRTTWSDRGEEVVGVRIGLFSLRGGFRTRFFYAGPITEEIHKFRARSVEPREEYLARLQRIVEMASDPETGVDILVLPELTMDGPGLDLLVARLADMAGRKDRKPPVLTVAGSFHFDVQGESPANLCTVLDHTGREIWKQAKSMPYATVRLPASWCEGCPPHLGPGHALREDIDPAREVVLVPSLLGWLAVAICSDLVPTASKGLEEILALPVDWLFIPSMSEGTDPFLEVARELVRDGRIVCFANAASILQGGLGGEQPAGASHPPRFGFVKAGGPPLAAFVNAPAVRPVGLWFDQQDAPSSSLEGVDVGLLDDSTWEGLVVVLPDFAGH